MYTNWCHRPRTAVNVLAKSSSTDSKVISVPIPEHRTLGSNPFFDGRTTADYHKRNAPRSPKGGCAVVKSITRSILVVVVLLVLSGSQASFDGPGLPPTCDPFTNPNCSIPPAM